MAAKKQPGVMFRTRIEFLMRQGDQNELREIIESMIEKRVEYDNDLNLSQIRLLCRILDAIEHPEVMA